MLETPILFSAAMIQAIREGRKTQTRRLVKLRHNNPLGVWEAGTLGGPGCTNSNGDPVAKHPVIWHRRTGDCLGCPYGAIGDRVWVRESYAARNIYDDDKPSTLPSSPECACLHYMADGPKQPFHGKTRPGIFMPRWASRLMLEITDVRVQRLQDISEEDARAEGITDTWDGLYWQGGTQLIDQRNPCFDRSKAIGGARAMFASLWDSINGKDKYVKGAGFGGETGRFESNVKWSNNPWVWALTFKVLEGSR